MSVKKNEDKNAKIKKIINLLNFIQTIDDLEVIKSTMESVVEMLQEELE